MPLATASAPSPSSDLHAAYLDYLQRTGRGNAAYSWAARVFFRRWPDPRGWAAETLPVRLSAGTSTRPIITFLMLHRALRSGYDYLLERFRTARECVPASGATTTAATRTGAPAA